MTVDPGFAGQQMVPSAMDKIRNIREIADRTDRKIRIMVDGQVNEKTAESMVQAGADILVLGSSGLFCHPKSKYAEVFEQYRKLQRHSKQ